MLMSKTYQNALINLSADAGIDSQAGCFFNRDPLDVTPPEIHNVALAQSWRMLPTAMHVFDWIPHALSFSRAWIHRERQLARRILHFTSKEIVWECCGIEGASFASEMLPGGAPFQHGLFQDEQKYQVGRLQKGLVEEHEEIYAAWNDICEHLSKKKLTKPTDMPIILEGLAKDYAALLPTDEYLAGLWRSTLPYALLWNTQEFVTDHPTYVAPSWSWLSAETPVKLANLGFLNRKHPLVSILGVSTELATDDTYGPVQKGLLELEGIIQHIRLVIDLEGYKSGPTKSIRYDIILLAEDGEELDDTLCEIGPSWEPYKGDMSELRMDSPIVLNNPVMDCFCLFVTIDNHRDISCLLLQPVEGESNTFSRVGTLLLKDLYALKMRYAPDGGKHHL